MANEMFKVTVEAEDQSTTPVNPIYWYAVFLFMYISAICYWCQFNELCKICNI